MLPSLSQIQDAAALIYRTLAPTPQICWPLLSERAGAEVWVKHENHLPSGAFKVRGGLVYLHELAQQRPEVRGVITATRGNHGQSVALAAARNGLEAVVVVPHGNSVEKNRAMRAWGAELIVYGDDFTEAADYAETLSAQRQLEFVRSFHPLLVRGVASYWLELLEAQPDLSAAYVPIGLGSGLTAGIAVRNALGLKTELVGVVSSAAPSYALSYAAGHVVEHPTTTRLADGMAVRRPSGDALEVIRRGAARVVQVSDEEIAEAMRAYFTDTHNTAEGAGAAALAAVLKEREQLRGKKVACILTGGNVDHNVFSEVLSG